MRLDRALQYEIVAGFIKLLVAKIFYLSYIF